MAFVASALTAEPRSFSIGPYKVQFMTFSAASGDTSGTITATSLSSISFVVFDGLNQTAQPTYSSNTATIAFADPLATVVGQILVYGK